MEWQRRRWRECGRKRGYPSEEQAQHAAGTLGRRVGVRIYVYACPHCIGWHLSHLPHRWLGRRRPSSEEA